MQSGPARRATRPLSRRHRRQLLDSVVRQLLQLDTLEGRLLMATTPTQVIFITEPPLTFAANSPIPTLEVAVEDPTGAIVTTDASTIQLSFDVNNAPIGAEMSDTGTNPNNYSTTVSAKVVNGIANFTNLSFNTVGTYYVRASDTTETQLNQATSSIFTITAAATQIVFNPQPGNVNAGDPFTISANIEDSLGDLVSTDHSTGTITVASGPGSLSGTTVATAASGVLTFSGLSLKAAGTYTLKITDGSLTGLASHTFTVSVGAPAALIFKQGPVNTPVGTTLAPVIVDVVDSSGNIIANDNSNVTLTIAAGPAGSTLTGTTTVQAVNGVATFSDLEIGQQGTNYVLQATNSESLTPATSGTFAITGPPAQLFFAHQPGQTTVGATIAPIVVDVEDSAGSIVTTDNSSVTLTVNSGPGSLSGTTTVQAVNGVATFSDLSLSQMGTYTLAAADGILTGATTSSFLINGLATHVAFTTEPTGGAAGAPLPTTVRVTVEDSAGNLVIDSSAIVTISIATGPTGSTLTGTTTLNAVNGVASFSDLVLSTKGTYTLAAASGTLGGDTSISFVITPSASLLVFAQEPSNVAAKSTMFPSIAVDIEDLNGNIVSTNTSTVTLAIIDPHGATIGGTTTVNAVAGVATFNGLSFAPMGSYTLLASDGNLDTVTSQRFTVTPMAQHLAWQVQPTGPVVAGAPMTFSVRVNDGDKFLVASDHSTVTLKIGTGPTGATIIGSTTASTIDGIATFTGIELDTAGKYTFIVTDGTLTGSTSNLFSVIPDITASTSNIETNLVLSSTSSTLVGRTLPTVKVEITDRFGNVITTSHGTITLNIGGSANAVLHGSITAPVVDGVARFGTLSFSAAGSFTLGGNATLTIGGLPYGATSSALGAALVISPVITTAGAPAHAATYKVGQNITLTGAIHSIKASPGVPFNGQVEVVDATTGQPIAGFGVANIGAGGGYTVSSSTLLPGNYSLRIEYAPADGNHTGTLSPAFKLTVGPTTTKLQVAATVIRNSTTPNDMLTATILAGLGNTASRAGDMVTFMDGNDVLGTATVGGNNTATFNANFTATGIQHVTAVFSGDSTNYAGSTSPIINVRVT